MGFFDLFRWRGDEDKNSLTESFIVVYVNHPDGVNADDGVRLRELFSATCPADWWFSNPGTFQAFFRTDESSRDQSEKLVSEINVLKNAIPSLDVLRIGVAEGPLLAIREKSGGLTFPPMGEASVRAMAIANEKR